MQASSYFLVFEGCGGGDRSLLWPFVASPAFRMAVSSLVKWLGRIRRIEILDWRIQPIDIANFAFVSSQQDDWVDMASAVSPHLVV